MKIKVFLFIVVISSVPSLSYNAEDKCALEGATAGGSTIDAQSCCTGLILTNRWTHFHLNEGCNFPPPPGSGGSCVKCGDGVCDSKHFENKCNCPKDCK